MDRSHVHIAMDMAKQDCDIAKADDPFGIVGQSAEIDPVDDMYGAISAPGAKDGFQRWIIQHVLQIGHPFYVGAAKTSVLFANGLTYFYPETPALDLLYGRLDLFCRDITRRAGNADGVTRHEIFGYTR